MQPELPTIAELEALVNSDEDIPPQMLGRIKAALTQYNAAMQQRDDEYREREAKLARDDELLKQEEEKLEAYKEQYRLAVEADERENQAVLANAKPLDLQQYAQLMKPLQKLGGPLSLPGSSFTGLANQDLVQVGYVNQATDTAFLRVSRSTRKVTNGQYVHVDGATTNNNGERYSETPDSQYDETLLMEQCIPLSLLLPKTI